MPQQTQNRKDLLQAYRLMTQRSALALIAGEPDSANQPLRRRNMATMSGVLAGVIACAVVGVMGMLSHGGSANGLTNAGTLVIDKDTATSYVPCQGHELCPTLNYASALLALKSANVNRAEVSQAALANYKIGPTLGIPGLPQDLPTSGNLVKGPWSVCTDGSGLSTLVGGASVGGTPLSATQAELVRSGGQNWVLWNGKRMKIADNFMTALWPQATPQQVTPAWLNTLPEAPDFTTPAIPGAGKQTRSPDGASTAPVGQVYEASNASGPQNYALGQDGKLHPLTQLQATLLEDVPKAPKPQEIASSTATSDIGAPLALNGLPVAQPTIPGFTSPVCVSYGAGMSRTITTGGAIPANATPTPNGGPGTVNQVWLPQGRGALIGVTTSASQSPAQSWFLLDGVTRYGLAGPGVASILGYNLASDQVTLPASLVDTLPAGRSLDPGPASQPVSG